MDLPDTREAKSRDAKSREPRGHETARAEMRIGHALHLSAEVKVSPRGILAIGALVSGILLSTSVLVATVLVARRR